MMNNQQLSDHELNLANFKLASENNAMLRILLENQLKIMDTLGISDAVSKFSFESVSPPAVIQPGSPMPVDELSRAEFENNIVIVNIISKNIRRRTWEWVQQQKEQLL